MESIANHIDFRDYTQLIINGEILSNQVLQDYCRNSKLTILHDIADFMLEWCDSSDFIQLHTSGSTGKPKTIRVQKKQMLQSAAATAQFFKFETQQKVLFNLPVKYIAGKMMIVRALYAQLNLICRFEPCSQPIQLLGADEFIDFTPLVPMQLHDVKDTKSVQKILLGGGAISLQQEEQFQQLKAEIYHSYGMTETLSHIAIRKVNGINRSNHFKTLPGVKLQLDERGCLVIQVSYIDGQIVTNDIVDLLSETEFIWRGRIDHVINSGGVKLHPEEIEREISSLIKSDFFVYGIPDNHLGEKLCLFIESSEYDHQQLLQIKRDILLVINKIKTPKEIFTLTKFSRTYSGKVKREETVRLFLAEKSLK